MRPGPIILAAALLAAALPPALALVRAALLALSDVHATRAALPDWPLLLRTIGIASLIAALATALAWPAAWALRPRPRGAPILVGAMLLPSYLASTGWGLLRAPGTLLGDLILRGPDPANPAANWYPIAAGFLQAVGGLTLWLWPIPALILLARFTRIDQAALDALRLDAPARAQRALVLLTIAAPATAAAFLAAFLLMLGSAVPLHIAQLDTYAIHLWRVLDQSPPDHRHRALIAAWPLILLAVTAGVLATRALARAQTDPLPDAPAPARLGSTAALAVLLVVAIGVPAALVAWHIPPRHATLTILRLIAPPMGTSLLTAAVVGGAIATLAGATWACLAAGGHAARLARVALGVWLVLGLMPGVLVGSASSQAWSAAALTIPALAPMADGWTPLILALIARFGFVGALAGLLFARAEPPGLADLRRLDAVRPVRVWIETSLLATLPILIGVWVAAGCLAMHEIEATVVLEPPTQIGGSLSRFMLQQLHFNRTSELVVGVLVLFGLALVAAAACVTAGRAWSWWGRGGVGNAARTFAKSGSESPR